MSVNLTSAAGPESFDAADSVPIEQDLIRVPFTEFDERDTSGSIQSRFARMARLYRDRVAVQTGETAISYLDLDLLSNRIANAILLRLGSGSEPVALLLDKGIFAIAAILGILKSGKAYVPLEPAQANSRDRYILADCGARLIVADAGHARLASSLAAEGVGILTVDETEELVDDRNPGWSGYPGDIAFLIYTSGSTGTPKGVIQTHACVLHAMVRGTNTLHISPSDRFTVIASCAAVASVSDIFGPLLNGGSVFPVDIVKEGFAGLRDKLVRDRITIWHTVPSIFRAMSRGLSGPLSVPSLRLIKLAGEPAYKSDFELYKKYLPGSCVFLVVLGTTEVATIRQFVANKETEIKEDVVPLGYATPGMKVVITGEDGEPLGPGAIGEIVIRSRHITPGYWRRPDLTAAAIRPDPDRAGWREIRLGDLGCMASDGCVFPAGRKDFQIKINGRKIMPAEIERALFQNEEVKQAAVMAEEDWTGGKRLAAYVSGIEGAVLSEAKLRAWLRGMLPDFMVPSLFTIAAELPLAPGGKIARGSLKALVTARNVREETGVEPGTSLEREVARVWQDSLGIPQIGVNQDFFELGGDSLAAARLMADMQNVFGKKLSPSSLLQAPTIAKMAGLIMRGCVGEESAIVQIGTDGAAGLNAPFFCVHGLGGEVLSLAALAKRLGVNRPFYGLKASESNGTEPAIEEIARRYVVEVKRIQPSGPYFLGGYSFGGIVAFEMARQLVAAGKTVALLAVLDTHAPGYPRPLPLLRRIMVVAKNSLRNWPESGSRYLAGRISVNATRARQVALGWVHRWTNRLNRPVTASVLNNPEVTNLLALKSYLPELYSGDIDLFRSTERRETYRYDPEYGWDNYVTGKIRIHEIPGDHSSIISEPHVGVLASKLAACLESYQGLIKGEYQDARMTQ